MRRLSMICATALIVPVVSLAAPVVDERSFDSETVDGTTGPGLEFTLRNTESEPNGDIFSWVIFKEGDRQAEATNGWRYQTVESVEEWTAPILSDRILGDDGNVLPLFPPSWSELFAPVDTQAQEFIENDGLQAHAFFLPFFRSEIEEPEIGFTLDGDPFRLPQSDLFPVGLSDEQDGFFALGDNTLGSPQAFAQLQAATGQPRQVSTNQFGTSVPAPGSMGLLGAGLIALGAIARRRQRV